MAAVPQPRVAPEVKDERTLASQWNKLIVHREELASFISVKLHEASASTVQVARDSPFSYLEMVYMLALHALLHDLARPHTNTSASVFAAGTPNPTIASEVVTLVESYLLGSMSMVRELRKSLLHTCMGWTLLSMVLRAYSVALTEVLAPPGAGPRCLQFLQRAVDGLSSSPQRGDALTVAHPILLHTARVAQQPAVGLRLLAAPLVRFSARTDGVSLADYAAYYVEGGHLLAQLGRWEAALDTLYNVVAMNESATFGSLEKVENIHDLYEGRLYRMPGLPKEDPCGDRYVPSPQEVASAWQLYTEAVKLSHLGIITAYGGGNPLEFFDTDKVKNTGLAHPAFKTTHLSATVIAGAAKGRATETRVAFYTRLLALASLRQGSQWATMSTTHVEVWKQDRLLPYVVEAGKSLSRHVILDLAQQFDTLYLHDIVAAIEAAGTGPSDATPDTREQFTLDLLRTMVASEELECVVEPPMHTNSTTTTARPSRVVHLAIPAKTGAHTVAELAVQRGEVAQQIRHIAALREQMAEYQVEVQRWGKRIQEELRL